MNRRPLLAMAVLGMLVAAAGCASGARIVRMTSNPGVPAAQGTVKSSPTGNGSMSIEVEVHHLVVPGRAAVGATSYVVWARERGEKAAQNLGELRMDEERCGTLKTVTPLHDFDLFITAEPSLRAEAPTSQQLFTVSLQRPAG